MFQLFNYPKELNTKTLTSYKNTDWNSFRQQLSDTTVINNNLGSPVDIDRELKLLTDNLIRAKNQHSKRIKTNPDRIEIDQVTMNLIKIRNRLRKDYQRSLRRETKREINTISRVIKNKIKKCLNQKWEKTLAELKPGDRTFWRITKTFKKQTETIPTIITNNVTYLTDKEKTDIISKTLEKIQENNEQTRIERHVTETVKEYLNSHPFTNPATIQLTNPREMDTLIKKLPNNKAPGMDEVDNKLHKNLPRKTKVQLMYIINGILKSGYFPKTWKDATVIPIPKSGKHLTNPINYRPISLLSSISKLTEKIILNRIQDFDRKEKVMIDEQFGFRRGHSTSRQVARIANSIIKNYNIDNITSMALLDIEKAFDTVWIDGITYKLIQYKFPVYLTRLINNYLLGRRFRVKINSQFSEVRNSRAGVAQGSVLGPVL